MARNKIEMMSIFKIAKQYYPKAYMREDGKIRLTKGSGYHIERVIENQIKQRMIDLKLAEFINKGATNIVTSFTTKSVYFNFNGIPHRISDHEKYFDGEQIIIDKLYEKS